LTSIKGILVALEVGYWLFICYPAYFKSQVIIKAKAKADVLLASILFNYFLPNFKY